MDAATASSSFTLPSIHSWSACQSNYMHPMLPTFLVNGPLILPKPGLSPCSEEASKRAQLHNQSEMEPSSASLSPPLHPGELSHSCNCTEEDQAWSQTVCQSYSSSPSSTSLSPSQANEEATSSQRKGGQGTEHQNPNANAISRRRWSRGTSCCRDSSAAKLHHRPFCTIN